MMTMAHAGFAYLAMTKTGSTAIERAFSQYAQLNTRRPPAMKHMTARSFTARIAPMLKFYGYPRESYELVSVVREPVDWTLSWYRYRSRAKAEGTDAYTGDIDFDEFADRVISGEAGLGNATAFVSRGEKVLVDRIYRYENLGDLATWMYAKLGKEEQPLVEARNVSPDLEVSISPSTRRRLEEHFAADVALYESAL